MPSLKTIALICVVPLVASVSRPPSAWSQAPSEPGIEDTVANGGPQPPGPQPPNPQRPGPVVVELFTSQGCSSCPPADALLRHIDSVAAERGLPVYALSYHVDYWNRLGWNDPYSRSLFSRRQQVYAKAAGSRRVYTPQMIVNGTTEFVGSDRKKAHAAINESLKMSSKHRVTVSCKYDPSKRSVTIDYSVDGDPLPQRINFAVVDSPSANEVTSGENSGRTLSHVNVVRDFKVVELRSESATGNVELELPQKVHVSESTVIAFIQDPTSRSILGATSIPAAGQVSSDVR